MNLSKGIEKKISLALIDYVYAQMNVGLISSLFCAIIIFFDLFYSPINHTKLVSWFIFFLMITALRMIVTISYKKHDHQNLVLWRRLYILGALLGGLSWGLPGIFFFHHVNSIQQTLMLLMLAGVTAGAVSLSVAIPKAAIAFLTFSILPYIISIALLKDTTYLLFDGALFLYFMYLIILSLKAYAIIKKSILLQFENTDLLQNLTRTKYQLELINKQLEQTATHDPLTQVANRRLFQVNFEEAIRRASRNNKILGLIYIDLDKFKPINDKYGHHIGDHVLLVVAKRLKNLFGSSDMIARMGGDEFTVIIENAKQVDDILNSAKRVCELLSSPIEIENMELRISASLGISIFPDHGTDAETLIHHADKTMYHTKMLGGNSFGLSKEVLATHP